MASPIMVGGLGRSGTTWWQWALSLHPRVFIAGQWVIDYELLLGWAAAMEAAAAQCRQMNQYHPRSPGEPPLPPHYAGSSPEATRALCREFIARWSCGGQEVLSPESWVLGGRETRKTPVQTPAPGPGPVPAPSRLETQDPRPARWGLKTVWMAANPQERAAWHRLFPGSRWIVCLRDPVATYRSLRQTFCPEMTPEEFSRRWHEVRQFLHQEPDRCRHFDLDRWRQASPVKRRAWMEEVLRWLDLEAEPAVLEAAEAFPRVNLALPPEKRPHVSELDLQRVRQLCG